MLPLNPNVELKPVKAESEWTAADVLQRMADTFRERNSNYKDNYKVVAEVMQALHPDGINAETKHEHEVVHLWYLIIVKLTRFAVSGLTHIDSIHDAAVYAAMLESIISKQPKEKQK